MYEQRLSSYLSVCPGLMVGDTVSAGEIVTCVRLTPGVKVKSDRVCLSLFQGDLLWAKSLSTDSWTLPGRENRV